ncbi:hypothetical protein GQ44DRAFT_697696 [Phaeosphaeriaceae sp. PMI808]|nr:hypothetical protein GQ44DRAFT_697696 [Phaeosphaeriaceae sp. PMI808]
MDEPARKRRKTASPPSSPLRKPPRRPSFASPTKASLARNYPNLVPSRSFSTGSPSRPSSRGNVLPRGKQVRSFALGESEVQETLSQEAAQEDAIPAAQNLIPRSRSAPFQSSIAELATTTTPPPQQSLEDRDDPPRGLLFSSPSKRPPRIKSPIKQPPVLQSSSLPLEDDDSHNVDVQELVGEKQPLDPEIERRKLEKARLQREISELESQVSRCTEEIIKEQQRSAVEVLRPSDRSNLQDFIAKISGADDNVKDSVPVSTLLCSFLPFSVITLPQPRTKEEKTPAPSHQPIKLADPMPYLEMFTSFNISTQISLPRSKSSSANRAHQKHTIDITGPQKLLTAQTTVTINSQANEIIGMNIVDLSPWAEPELGTFLRKRAHEKDLSNACWAIETYWTIAQKRAQYWNRCETTFAHLLIGQINKDTENRRSQTNTGTKMSRKDLNRHLGRDSLVLQDKHVLLKVNWRIAFDWTGEAESDVTIETAFPSAWTEADAGRALSKVPETFVSLVQSRGAFEATKVVTALLFTQ